MDPRETSHPAVPTTRPRSKKAYETPRLALYGTISQLTRTTGNQGTSDGGTAPLHKTH